MSAEAVPDSLVLSPARLRASGIDLVHVDAQALTPELIGSGVVSSAVGAEAVVRLLKRLGDTVRTGETVAVIESRDASTIAAESATARAQLDAARAKYAREDRLFRAGVTARQDLEAVRAELAVAEAEARRTTAAGQAARVAADGRTLAVVSPTAGRISAAPVALGAFVTAGTELYRVVDPSRIEIRVSIPATEAGRVPVGASARIEVAGGSSVAAVVRAVTPEADPVSRAATVMLAPSGGQAGLRPGQAVRASIAVPGPATGSTITVPAEAVQLLDGREVVFVRTAAGFRVQPVTAGARTGDRVQITTGLDSGTLVAGRNAFLLKAELAKGSEEEEGGQ